MTLRLACVWLVGGVLAGAVVAAAVAAAQPPAAAKAGEAARPPVREAPAVIDDARLLRTIESAASKLIDDGKTTPMADLVKQLDRTRCAAKLPRPSGKTAGAAAVYSQCRPGVLVMAGVFKCEKCGKRHLSPASGFALTESGIAVTNYHVLNQAKHITLVAATADGTVYPVKEVLAASATSDVAVVQVAGLGFTPVALAPDAPVGTDVFVISHPDGRFYTMTRGIVSRYGTVTRAGKATAVLQITADYAKGSSGAPVLNGAGDAVGMASSTVSIYYDEQHGKKENLQMVLDECIPASQILELIQAP